jgi:hypothetical protein
LDFSDFFDNTDYSKFIGYLDHNYEIDKKHKIGELLNTKGTKRGILKKCRYGHVG